MNRVHLYSVNVEVSRGLPHFASSRIAAVDISVLNMSWVMMGRKYDDREEATASNTFIHFESNVWNTWDRAWSAYRKLFLEAKYNLCCNKRLETELNSIIITDDVPNGVDR